MTEDFVPRGESAVYETLELPRRSLKALAGMEDLGAGPLSPLGRMTAPPGAADADALISAWEKLEGAWSWAVPALLDPHRTIALVMGDGNAGVVGQYLFPDADAWGPGFHMSVGENALTLTGPLGLWLLEVGLYSRLALEDVAEVDPFRVDLSADHFWTLMACLDAYRAATLVRRIRRIGGGPSGVRSEDVARLWSDGVSLVDPGWAVSLFSILVPELVPQDLAEKIPHLLAEMSRLGHLREVVGPDGGGALYALPEALSPLLWGPTTAINFGLVTQSLVEPAAVEFTALGGWRTPGGVWLADLSEIESEGVRLLLAGPLLASDIIDGVLGDDSLAAAWDRFAMDTPYTRDDMVSRLRAMPEGEESVKADAEIVSEAKTPASRSFCTACGNPIEEGLAFCNKCGKRVGGTATSQVTCTACGNPIEEGLAFCNKCGKRV
ncbi:MAG: zinc ribbon domain-containing protein [Actinomycetota bacterium]